VRAYRRASAWPVIYNGSKKKKMIRGVERKKSQRKKREKRSMMIERDY